MNAPTHIHSPAPTPKTEQPTLASPGDMFMVPPDTTYQLINHSTKVKAMMYYTIVDFVTDDDEEMAATEAGAEEVDGEGEGQGEEEELPADKSTAKKDDVEDEVKAEAAEAPPIVAMEASDAANAVPLPGDEGGSSGGGVRVVAESNV